MKLSMATCSLALCAATTLLAHAQGREDDSIAEPTAFAVAASGSGAEIVVLGTPHRIDSTDSSAELASVELKSTDGTRQRGLRVSLERPGAQDRFYLDTDQASRFRAEFVELGSDYGGERSCEAIVACAYGIARCRPSQDVVQAYCPSAYEYRSGETGIELSTPRSSFRFPSVHVKDFVEAIDAAGTQ